MTELPSSSPQSWQVYLLRCADGTLYCGVARDVRRRIRQHNGELAGGARYTASRRPVALIARASAATRSEALQLECFIKKLPRRKKLAALQSKADINADF